MLQKYKCVQGKILGHSLCGSLLAEKLGRAQFFFMNSLYMVESFNCHGELVHTLIHPVQLRQPLCFSARYLISFLQLFTRLEDVALT